MGGELVRNASDKNQVRNARKKERRTREQELNDIRYVLADRRGRRFFWQLLCGCRLFELSYTGNQNDTFFNEGMRNVGNKLIADLNDAEPEAYFTMLSEDKKEKENGSNDTSGPGRNNDSGGSSIDAGLDDYSGADDADDNDF